MKRSKFIPYIAAFIIIAMSTSFTFARDNRGMNLLLVGTMSLAPFLLMVYNKIRKYDVIIFLLIICMYICAKFHPESFRMSTIIYSALFCFTFSAYLKILYTYRFTTQDYLKLLRLLIYSFFFMLVVQQLCILINIPPINVSLTFNNRWKLPSLATEPSHAARFVALFMFSYIKVKTAISRRKYDIIIDGKKDLYLWGAFFWLMLMMGSGTAFLLLPIVLLQVLSYKNLIPAMVVLLAIGYFTNITDNEAAIRTIETTKATLSFNEKEIIEADHSASLRIVPIIMSVKMIDFADINTWFGHGIDFIASSFYLKFPGVKEGHTGGGMATFLVEYGLISFVLFLVLTLRYFDRNDFSSFLLYLIIVLAGTINSQITWSAMLLFATNKFFINKKAFFIQVRYEKMKLIKNFK